VAKYRKKPVAELREQEKRCLHGALKDFCIRLDSLLLSKEEAKEANRRLADLVPSGEWENRRLDGTLLAQQAALGKAVRNLGVAILRALCGRGGAL
jgi:hypothetical protein